MLNHKVKGHRGRVPREQYWAICMADTTFTPARAYITHIENKTTSVILPIIKKVIRPGSVIHTDEARVYNKLGK